MVSRIKTWLKKHLARPDYTLSLPKSLSGSFGRLPHKFFKNDRVGFFGIMALALLLIILKGPSSEGQTTIFNNSLVSYIEETAASVIDDIPDHQLADINSVFAYSGRPNRITGASTLSTIQDNSVVSRGAILTNIIDEFYNRGSEVAIYEVQEGDTISFIASDYGVKLDSIVASNNLRNVDDIVPGMKLKIPPVDGVVYKVKKGDTVTVIAQRYGVEADEIINFNSLPQEGNLQTDIEIVIPGGKLKTQASGLAAAGTAKRFAYLPDLSSFFSLPALGFNWGRIHGRNGVDIANSCGTPIYAASDGSIASTKTSGWNGGFGKFIKLVHSNGTETLYAHLSKILIKPGEYISKNQEIALMGSTGRSTGCHLHFEVHGAKNPLARY